MSGNSLIQKILANWISVSALVVSICALIWSGDFYKLRHPGVEIHASIVSSYGDGKVTVFISNSGAEDAAIMQIGVKSSDTSAVRWLDVEGRSRLIEAGKGYVFSISKSGVYVPALDPNYTSAGGLSPFSTMPKLGADEGQSCQVVVDIVDLHGTVRSVLGNSMRCINASVQPS